MQVEAIPMLINSDFLNAPLDVKLHLADYKMHGKKSYVFQIKDLLHGIYKCTYISMNDQDINGEALDYLLKNNSHAGEMLMQIADLEQKDLFKTLRAMTAVVNSTTAMTAVLNNTTAMTAVFNSATAMAAVVNSTTAMTAVLNNTTAMTAVFNSATAMAAVVNSTTAMTAVLNNTTAMTAVFNSATAMAAVVNSTTAMTAVLNNTTAMTAVFNSATAMAAVVNSTTAMTAVLNNTTAMTTVLKSANAMEAVVNSTTAMTAVLNSATAMTAVVNSTTAMTTVLDSETAIVSIVAAQYANIKPFILKINGNKEYIKKLFILVQNSSRFKLLYNGDVGSIVNAYENKQGIITFSCLGFSGSSGDNSGVSSRVYNNGELIKDATDAGYNTKSTPDKANAVTIGKTKWGYNSGRYNYSNIACAVYEMIA